MALHLHWLCMLCIFIIRHILWHYFNFVDDWKADQYRWYQNETKLLPSGMPVVIKVYAVNVNDKGKNVNFKRLSYTLIDNSSILMLIHYTGDHTTAINLPMEILSLKVRKPLPLPLPFVIPKS